MGGLAPPPGSGFLRAQASCRVLEQWCWGRDHPPAPPRASAPRGAGPPGGAAGCSNRLEAGAKGPWGGAARPTPRRGGGRTRFDCGRALDRHPSARHHRCSTRPRGAVGPLPGSGTACRSCEAGGRHRPSTVAQNPARRLSPLPTRAWCGGDAARPAPRLTLQSRPPEQQGRR